MRNFINPSLMVTALLTVAGPAVAIDARSTALGGSTVASGKGVHGVMENPASLMRMQRKDIVGVHLRFGSSLDLRDNGEVVDTLTDDANTDLADSIPDGIESLNNETLTCQFDSPAETVCLSNTGALGEDADQILRLFNDLDGNPVEGRVTGDLGLAITKFKIPFAIHLHASVTGGGQFNLDTDDVEYIDNFAEAFDDGQVTRGEAGTAAEDGLITVDFGTLSPVITLPEDALMSQLGSSALVRQQIGLSFGYSLPIVGLDVDFGVTPKFSTLTARDLDTPLGAAFEEDGTQTLEDNFEDSETVESSFTMDIGASAAIKLTPFRVAAVLRNVIPESVETENGFEFETTPQLIVGGAVNLGIVEVNADLALNSAKLDNFETQPLSLGVEFGSSLFALRAGVAVDAAREDNATALTLGFGLGPLQLGARVSELTSAQISAQLSFGF